MTKRKIDQKDYKYYVLCKKSNKILSGWEYREDARDFVEETGRKDLKIYTRSYLKRLGIDPKDNSNWGSELGKAIYHPIPEVVLSGDFKKDIQIPEIKVRFNRGKTFGKISDSDGVYKFLLKVYGNQISIQEHFVLLLFDNHLNILGYYKHTVGTPVSTLADIPMLMGIVLKTMARSFVISHNHPSGNRNPSDADRSLTQNMKQAAKSLNLTMLDHVIVTKDNGYYSFADTGQLMGISKSGNSKESSKSLEDELREEILSQLKKVMAHPKLTPQIHQIIQNEKGYRWVENRILHLMITDDLTASAAIPQIESEL